ncbi:SIS domain-containing protein [uncultured Desulfobacter sp.]|uniref:SIS domain-containing protein n=1 Tax=uncultured Desulfobacter sp. TaxID=240139 RepID=UPI0029F5B6F2|nr:SIS domain-containing protein [uncultured Desulfobacter sp.]
MNDILKAGSYLNYLNAMLMETQITDNVGHTYSLDDGVARMVSELIIIRNNGGLLALVGNGGSAAIVDHVHNDLGLSCGMCTLVFTNTPSLTAASNDFGYAAAYERQLACWSDYQGALLAISSSGASENILRAAKKARAIGMKIFTMTGFQQDNPLRKMGELNFYIKSDSYGIVELAHSCIAHCVTDTILMTSKNEKKI